MRFWVVLMGVNELDQLVDLARHAEACGFHGLTSTRHLEGVCRCECRGRSDPGQCGVAGFENLLRVIRQQPRI